MASKQVDFCNAFDQAELGADEHIYIEVPKRFEFAEGDDLAALHANVRDAVRCHFDDGQAPKVLRLHFVREEVIAV